MTELMNDPMFFYGIAFAIFLALAVKYGRAPMLAWIDGQIVKIRSDLEQAEALRKEAEASLETYKAKQAEAMKEAEAIIAQAKQDAEMLRQRAEHDLKASLQRHEQQALERIRVAEMEALEEVRTKIVAMAVAAAEKTLAAKLDDKASSDLMDQAIAGLGQSSNVKSHAA
ncbi:MAG: F0F1 ATP synthase subunit B [Alphaproteobacteria bacterium]|nr:F0F1 ATP synthase subunit B [Alphaproteobacteria bacterium]MBV8548378.1 F0F1 ATP synthase subunit B [Alphaproteobacteria bacterium]